MHERIQSTFEITMQLENGHLDIKSFFSPNFKTSNFWNYVTKVHLSLFMQVNDSIRSFNGSGNALTYKPSMSQNHLIYAFVSLQISRHWQRHAVTPPEDHFVVCVQTLGAFITTLTRKSFALVIGAAWSVFYLNSFIDGGCLFLQHRLDSTKYKSSISSQNQTGIGALKLQMGQRSRTVDQIHCLSGMI